MHNCQSHDPFAAPLKNLFLIRHPIVLELKRGLDVGSEVLNTGALSLEYCLGVDCGINIRVHYIATDQSNLHIIKGFRSVCKRVVLRARASRALACGV